MSFAREKCTQAGSNQGTQRRKNFVLTCLLVSMWEEKEGFTIVKVLDLKAGRTKGIDKTHVVVAENANVVWDSNGGDCIGRT